MRASACAETGRWASDDFRIVNCSPSYGELY
jgi:hypothetical protein